MNEDYASTYSLLEYHHWWFRGRRRILRELIARLDWPNDPSILEIGAGSGANLAFVFPKGARLRGVEPFPPNAEIARKRTNLRIDVATAEQLPPDLGDDELDAIAMFDVLEHTRDDMLVLQEVRRRIKPGGRLLLTVPAYRWMWGRQDIVSQHFRRYTRSELVVKLEKSGYVVRRATYFNTLLFPLIAGIRLLARLLAFFRRHGTFKEGSDFDHSSGACSIMLENVFAAERYWLHWCNFPLGVSVFVEAIKDPAFRNT